MQQALNCDPTIRLLVLCLKTLYGEKSRHFRSVGHLKEEEKGDEVNLTSSIVLAKSLLLYTKLSTLAITHDMMFGKPFKRIKARRSYYSNCDSSAAIDKL